MADAIPLHDIELVNRYWPNQNATNTDLSLVNAAHLIEYFGAPAGGIEQMPREQRMMDRFQFPKAFAGKSDYLREVILGLTVDTQDWAFSEPDGLPLRQANALVVTWSSWRFEEGTMERVPEEGTVRVASSGFSRNQVTILRRGKGITLEHGFWNTPEGKIHYGRQLLQLSNFFRNTLALDAQITLLNARKNDVEYLVKSEFAHKMPVDVIKYNCKGFLSFNKHAYAAEALVSECKTVLEARGKGPEMMILPRGGTEVLMRGAINSAKLDAHVVGGSVAERRMGEDPNSMATFEGLRLRWIRRYSMVETGQSALNPFKRDRIFGEHAQMRPHPVSMHLNNMIPDNMVTAARSIRIMDYQMDRMVTIGLKQAMQQLEGEFSEIDEAFNNDPLFGGAAGAPVPLGPTNLNDKVLRGHGMISMADNASLYTQGKSVKGARVIRSPLECMGYTGVQNCVFFGQMPLMFLSNEVIDLMVSQLDRLFAPALPNGVANPDGPAKREQFTRNLAPVIADAAAWNNNLARRQTALAVVGRTANDLANDPQTSVTKKYVKLSSDLGKRQRTEGSDSRITYGSFLAPAQAVGSAATPQIDVEQLHAQNAQKLATIEPKAAEIYTGLRDRFQGAEFDAYVQRTSAILETSPSTIQQALLTPLNITLKAPEGTKQEKILAQQEALRTLADFRPKIGAPTIPATAEAASPSLHSLDEVEERVAAGEKFQALHPSSDSPLSTPFEFDLTSTAGILELGRAAQKANYSTDLNPLVGQDGRNPADRVRAGRPAGMADDAWKRLTLTDLDYRLSSGAASPTKMLLLFQRLTYKFFMFLIENNIFFPFTILLFRPWVCISSNTTIIGTGGSRCGCTYMKNADVMLGDDPVSKMHHANFTVYTKAVVHNPDLLCVRDDISLNDYYGGGNARFLEYEDLNLIKQEGWRTLDNDARGGLIPVLAAYTENQMIPDVLHMSGSFDHSKDAIPDVFYEPTRLTEMVNGGPADEHPYLWNDLRFNRITVQMLQLCYNPMKKDFMAVIRSDYSRMGDGYSGMVQHMLEGNMILRDMKYTDQTIYADFASF